MKLHTRRDLPLECSPFWITNNKKSQYKCLCVCHQQSLAASRQFHILHARFRRITFVLIYLYFTGTVMQKKKSKETVVHDAIKRSKL